MSSESARGAVVLTREPPDNDALARRLAEEGFEVLEWPAVATEWLEPPGGAAGLAAAIGRASLVAFTSRRAVAAAERLLAGLGGLAVATAGRKTAAVGPATAQALLEAGAPASLVAEGRGWREFARRLLATDGTDGDDQNSESLGPILLVRSAAAEDGLPEALAAGGRLVEDVRLHGPGCPPEVRAEERPLAAIACASPGAARRMLEWNPWTAACTFVAIGPSTAATLREDLGVARVVEAAGPTDDDLLTAIRAAARGPERP